MMNINIHIFIAIYLILKYCIHGPVVVINYRNMKLLINIGRCALTDRKRCFQTKRKVLHPISHSEFHCVEYIDGNRVYNGMLTTHHKNHLHILETAPVRLHTA